MISRRRFLAISAAAVAAPPAGAKTWQGRALGANVSITLRGPDRLTANTLAGLQYILKRMETLFSLHDPTSALSRLNRTGRLATPPHDFSRLCRLCSEIHTLTDGLFDPTVQPLWQALARGGDPAAARGLIGWAKVMRTADGISLAPGQQLTFNGIAQGYATDRVAAHLHAAGFGQTLVNIGEFAAVGGPWRLGIEDPTHGIKAITTLRDRAIATSSPGALALGRDTHILNPVTDAPPRWSTVSVETASAALADGLSTAFCHMTRADIRVALRALPGRPLARLVSHEGSVSTLV
ncbi:FAD:protein FMN transferase [Marimonas arenosa]|uniref:FAD:protein FMN transferase n=1 Tax=Marimonas arenosa TaxID=1795305 RepID=A0AAE4B364_9RHOB|nr:FAD:protein FMN transferase [Marimonas arenosa]MDQ2089718.1 FAD:protein FMN transferase [Marimonas arenosa]